MTESPESSAQTAGANPPPRTTLGATSNEQRFRAPSRLNQAAAWVGIVAGVLFIVAVIFFTGLVIGRSTAGYDDWQRGYHNGQMAPCKAQHGGMMGRGGRMNPSEMGPGQMRPGQTGPADHASPTPSPGPRP